MLAGDPHVLSTRQFSPAQQYASRVRHSPLQNAAVREVVPPEAAFAACTAPFFPARHRTSRGASCAVEPSCPKLGLLGHGSLPPLAYRPRAHESYQVAKGDLALHGREIHLR